jgi:hypothetical protein
VPQATAVLTRTIGSGKDYASFTLAEADVTNIGASADLVFENEAIVFEADAGTYNETFVIDSSLVCDSTRNVTYQSATLGQAIISNATTASVIKITNGAFTTLRGLTIDSTGSGGSVRGFEIFPNSSKTCEGCLLDSLTIQGNGSASFYAIELQLEPTGAAGGAGSATNPTVIQNCVEQGIGNGLTVVGNKTDEVHLKLVNCTFSGSSTNGISLASANDVTTEMVNCINLGHAWSFRDALMTGVATTAGSNNFGGSTNPFPVATQGSPYPITATTDLDPGPGDWAIYDAATGALIDDPDNDVLAGGIGPDANPDVPTTDIVGNTRSGATTDPGAFEISTLTPPAPALITIMRQIYQQDASFSIGASSAGVEKITHQPGPASADYFTINSTTSATVSVPRTAHALRVICVVASKACDVTLDLDASNSVYLGSIGGVASVQTDLTYFWSFGQVVSDGTYPRVRIADDGFSGDQLVYLWWHLA